MDRSVTAAKASPARRLLAIITGIALVALGMLTAGPIAAQADESAGSISGTVTGASSAPLDGVLVQLFHCDPEWDPTTQYDCWVLLHGDGQSTYTDASGSFEISDLVPGEYRAVIHPQGVHSTYVYEYWDGADELEAGTTIIVSAGQASVINPTLEQGASVSGTVLDEHGVPVSGGYVYAYLSTYSGGTRGGASVQSDGTYVITGLPAGEYYFTAGPSWSGPSTLVPSFWPDALDAASAQRVVLSGTQSFTADFELPTGAVISGTATAAGGSGIAGLSVQAYRYSAGYWSSSAQTTTNAAGTYELSGLNVGDYIVRFSDFNGTWSQQYYGGGAEQSSATVLSLVPGDTANGINVELVQGASLAGTITQRVDGTTSPADGGFIELYRQASGGGWDYVTYTNSDASGVFSITGLAAGVYTLKGYGAGGDSSWAGVYLGDVYYPEEATALTLGAGASVTGADVTSVPGVTLTGTVVDEFGGPAEGVWASILYERAPGVWDAPPPHGQAGDPISYWSSALPPGNYIVEFADHSDSETPYITQYWQNAATFSEATIIAAPDGGTFNGISAVMTRTVAEPLPLTPGSVSVSGTVRVGHTVTADAGSWGPVTPEFTFEFYRFDPEDSSSTLAQSSASPEYTLQTADGGKQLYVKVIGAAEGYVTTTAVGGWRYVLSANLTPGTVSVSGTPRVGHTLTADAGTWGPVSPEFEFEFYRYDPVAGTPTLVQASASGDYTVQAADAGKQLYVKVIGSAEGYNPLPVVGGWRAVLGGNFTPGTVSVSGTPRVGQTLTADAGTWGPVTPEFEFEFYRFDPVDSSSTLVQDSASADYTVQAADAGKQLYVKVIGSAEGYNPLPAVGGWRAVLGGNLAPVAPVVTGTPKVGQTLTVDAGDWGASGVSYTYEFYRYDPVAGTATLVQSSASSAYELTAAEGGQQLYVKVIGSAAGYNTISIIGGWRAITP